jgi:exodeoxyribonuclease-3
MNIASWNVNGIRSVEKKGFLEWLSGSGAEVVCLQETKARPEQLSKSLVEPTDEAGNQTFRTYWASAKKAGYSGVAVLCRQEPEEVCTLGVEEFDNEGRVLAVRFGDLVVISAYFPNSQEGGARLAYKLGFCQAMLEFCQGLVAAGKHIVLCGDYNIAHKPIDLAHPKANEGNPGYLPEERAWMDTWTNAGFVDTFRHFCQEPHHYSWWSYRSGAREHNVGWRIDYHCVDAGLLPRVTASSICPEVLGSDHCPVVLTLD